MDTAAKTDFADVLNEAERNLPDTADRLQSVGPDFQGTIKSIIYICYTAVIQVGY